MTTLLKKFERFIKKESLFESESKLLVAVSGGLDSMVLTHLLNSLGYSITIAHCNFQLRGNNSTLDASFVANYAANLELPHYQTAFDTTSYMADHQLSLQEAARNLRYEWFGELMQQHDLEYLVTAHHANDQAETILYNLTKGTGIAGIRGIPLNSDRVRRPLLFATREEIEKYAKHEKLQWREDASNQEDKYSRNRIRNQVIPELKQINPGLERTMLNNSKRFTAIESLLNTAANKVKLEHLKESKNNTSINLDWFDETTGGLAILSELLKPFGFNWDQCCSIAEGLKESSNQQSGNKFYAKDFTLFVDRRSLVIETNDQESLCDLEINEYIDSIATPWHVFLFEVTDGVDTWTTNPNEAYLDADRIDFPIRLRNWQQGDAFVPLGMKGKKKLSDFMIDEKIPVNLKSRVVLFESNNEIIWLAGHRIDDRYKITPKTKRVLIIKMTDHV